MIEKLNEILGIDLLQKSKREEVVWARFACFKFMREQGLSYLSIGEAFGMSHASVIHGVNEFNDKLSINDPLAVRYWNELKDMRITSVITTG